MGIFGNNAPAGQMFGNRPAGIDEAAMGQFPAQAPKRKGGIFGGMDQNKWLMLAAVLGGGRNQLPLQFMMQQKQAEQERAQAEAQRQQQFEDWRQRFDYERANTPADVAPMIRDLQAWQAMTPEQRKAYQELQDARSGPVVTTLPGNRFYAGPRGGLAAAMRGMAAQPKTPPREAIDELRADPASAAEFDAAFGPGSAARILGGAGSNASGGFQY